MYHNFPHLQEYQATAEWLDLAKASGIHPFVLAYIQAYPDCLKSQGGSQTWRSISEKFSNNRLERYQDLATELEPAFIAELKPIFSMPSPKTYLRMERKEQLPLDLYFPETATAAFWLIDRLRDEIENNALESDSYYSLREKTTDYVDAAAIFCRAYHELEQSQFPFDREALIVSALVVFGEQGVMKCKRFFEIVHNQKFATLVSHTMKTVNY